MKDIIGERFGKLVVLEYVGSGKCKCKCDCGKEKIVLRANLTTKNTRSATRSCGCGQARRAAEKELLDPLWEKIKKGERSKELEARLNQIVKDNNNEYGHGRSN